MAELPRATKDLDAVAQDARSFLESPPRTAAERIRRESEALEQLEGHYWEAVVGRVVDRCGQTAPGNDTFPAFGRDDRLLLDAAWLEPAVYGADMETLRIELIREIYGSDRREVLYFSDYLERRFLSAKAVAGLDRIKRVADQHRAGRRDREGALAHARTRRLEIYATLAPVLVQPQGVPLSAVEAMADGRLDDFLEALLVRFLATRDTARLHERARFQALKERALASIRDAAVGAGQGALLDELAALDRRCVANALSVHREDRSLARMRKTPPVDLEADTRAATAAMRTEVEALRSLFLLGAIGAGLRTSGPFFGLKEQRLTRPFVGALLDRIREFDLGFHGNPTIVIAPFRGAGFFDWERGTIFLPLAPVGSPDKAVVVAVANFRMVFDALQEEGRLKRAFRRNFPTKTYRERFVAEYVKWILRTGVGLRGAQDVRAYRFFQRRVGPNPEGVMPTPELVNLSPEQVERRKGEALARVRSGEATHADHYALAYFAWREDSARKALENLEAAAKLDPSDGRTLLALAYYYRRGGLNPQARRCLLDAKNVAAGTLWQAYAAEALEQI